MATARQGQKLETAAKEGGGLAGAWAGGVVGAEGGALGGPWGAAGGGILGSIVGGFGGKGLVDQMLNGPEPTLEETNARIAAIP